MKTLTISRTELSLSPLVIPADPFAGTFHLPEDGLNWPRLEMRKVYAPESEFIGGRVKLAQVPGINDRYPVDVYAHAATTAALFIAQDELEAAVCQFEFSLTIAVDGQSRTYRADGNFPDWGEVDTGQVRAHLVKGTVEFTLYERTS